MSKVHIGKKIKEVWKKSGMKGTVFASLINRDRQVIYDIFKKEAITTEMLEKIGEVLEHDFFIYYAKDPLVTKEPGDNYNTIEHLNQITKELTSLKAEVIKLRKDVSNNKKAYLLKNKKSKSGKNKK